MSEKTYSVVEIFTSVQGEGVRAGTVNVFIRFAGCNLTCAGEMSDGVLQPLCDTDFTGGRKLTAAEIVAEAREAGGACRWVVLTGGEPALQVDREMLDELHEAGYEIAIETNGTRELPPTIDWVCVSPKTAAHTLKVEKCDEVKFVVRYGQALPKPRLFAKHKVLSPAWDADGLDRKNLAWAIALCKEHPEWRLSTQLHKVWQVR